MVRITSVTTRTTRLGGTFTLPLLNTAEERAALSAKLKRDVPDQILSVAAIVCAVGRYRDTHKVYCDDSAGDNDDLAILASAVRVGNPRFTSRFEGWHVVFETPDNTPRQRPVPVERQERPAVTDCCD